MFKKPQNLEETQNKFQTIATANEYIITTNLLNQQIPNDLNTVRDNATTTNQSPTKNLKSSNLGKPTNIDKYLEEYKATSSKSLEQWSNGESSDSACGSIILTGTITDNDNNT